MVCISRSVTLRLQKEMKAAKESLTHSKRYYVMLDPEKQQSLFNHNGTSDARPSRDDSSFQIGGQ